MKNWDHFCMQLEEEGIEPGPSSLWLKEQSGEYQLIAAILQSALRDVGPQYCETKDFKYYCGLLGADPKAIAAGFERQHQRLEKLKDTRGGRSKLTPRQRDDIKAKREQGASLSELSDEYQVTMSSIHYTCNGRVR